MTTISCRLLSQNNSKASIFSFGSFVIVLTCVLCCSILRIPRVSIYCMKHRILQPRKQANKRDELKLNLFLINLKSLALLVNSSVTRAMLEHVFILELHVNDGDSLEPREISRQMPHELVLSFADNKQIANVHFR